MNSQIREDSVTGSKITKTEIRKIYYPPPNHKQFIAYSYAKKESGLGIMFNDILLLLDSMKKSLGYYSKFPDPLPHPEQKYDDPKQTVFIRKIKNFEFRATKTEAGSVNVKWSELNGPKKLWALKFKTNALMNEWIITVNEVIQDGHLQPENRPVSTSRYSVKKNDTSRYATPFILQTGGIESRRSSIAQSAAQSSISTSKNSTNWLTQPINQKQKQITMRHNQIHNIGNKKEETQPEQQAHELKFEEIHKLQKQQKISSQKIESVPISTQSLNSAESDKTIKRPTVTKASIYTANPILEQKQDESKVSNKQSEMHNSESVKKFRINLMPPVIDEEDNSFLEHIGKKQVKSNIKIQQLVPLQNEHGKEEQKNEESRIRQRTITQTLINNLKLTEKLQNPITSRGRKISQYQKFVDRSENQYNWTDPKVYYAYLYGQFVKKCQQISVGLIDNLASIVSSAQKNPTDSLYLNSTSLILIEKKIEFSVQLKLASADQSALSIKQHSSIISYINRLSQSQLGEHKIKIIPLPNCVISYRWYQIKCKALINEQKYVKMLEDKNKKALDQFFSMPPKVWDYYCGEDGIVVDHTNTTVTPDEITDDLINRISQNLCRQDPIIGNIKDLQLYCQSHHNTTINLNIVVQIFERCYRMNTTSPPCSTLLSIIYAIKISEYIKAQLFNKMHTLSSAEMKSKINDLICEILLDINKISNVKVTKQLQKQLQAVGINFRAKQLPGWIDSACVWGSLAILLTMDAIYDQKLMLGEFKLNTFQIRIEALSEEMAKIQEILNQCDNENISEDKKYLGYLAMIENLEKYNELLLHSHSKNSNPFKYRAQIPTHTPPRECSYKKYSNLSLRIYHYQSLYKPYFPVQFQTSQKHTDTYNMEMQQIMNSTPPTYYSYLISINCLKWVSKKGTNNLEGVYNIMIQQIQWCKKWRGQHSLFMLGYYQLCSVYHEQIFNVYKAIEYARLALQIVNSLYGENSAQAAERWFLLGNVSYEDDDFYEQALQAYQKSLKILQKYDSKTPDLLQSFTSSRATLLPFQTGTGQAQVTIRLKMIKLYLALNNITKCLEESSICLGISQQLPNPNPYSQLDIFSSLIKCLEITKEYRKLQLILDTTAHKFGLRINQIYPNCSDKDLQYEQELRQNVIKVCLASYIALKITDETRKKYLLKMVKSVRTRYQARYNKKQYNTYVTKILHGLTYSESDTEINAMKWFLGLCKQIPVFSSYMRGRGISRDPDEADIDQINYNLYQNPLNKKINATQNKMAVPLMKAMEAMGGIIGFSYLIACFSK